VLVIFKIGAVGVALVVRVFMLTARPSELCIVRVAVLTNNAHCQLDSERCFDARDVDLKKSVGKKQSLDSGSGEPCAQTQFNASSRHFTICAALPW
jgi:hypothetical protein